MPQGIFLTPDNYEALIERVDRDCKVLESFSIMDYSLLLGLYNIDHALRERAEVWMSVVILTSIMSRVV